ncbi:hypothetical protein ACF09E_21590 [Streptomyces sp. NPDC014891]|uniref:hypothetical protein n=1 Tax=Streptomyces sp. NPDC014891 TaxID=3364929 RepID=UPI0037010F28
MAEKPAAHRPTPQRNFPTLTPTPTCGVPRAAARPRRTAGPAHRRARAPPVPRTAGPAWTRATDPGDGTSPRPGHAPSDALSALTDDDPSM